MKIKKLILNNYRGYRTKTEINFNSLTTIIGKNDAGKSTILQALDVFFNDAKIDENDINVANNKNGNRDIEIGVEFCNLPDIVDLDGGNLTTLKDEYLLTENGTLRVIKRIIGGKKTMIYIEANHPKNIECCDLLSKKNADLKKMIEKLNIQVEDMRKNASMRKAIWNYYDVKDNLENVLIDISTKDGDIKSIYEKLLLSFPLYSLFKVDRKNEDSDSEIQDPLKEAVKIIFNTEDIQNKLNEIAESVKDELQKVSTNTLKKLEEIDKNIAEKLHPVIPETKSLKWAEVFKNVSIEDDKEIAINNRGSGIKRLVLISFFRAQAEEKLIKENKNGIIYAIEEPETSQHTDNQKVLLDAFKKMINENNEVQIIITTHSGYIVKQMEKEDLRIVKKDVGNENVIINEIKNDVLPYVSLNEINYTVFGDVTTDYFDELFSYIDLGNKDTEKEYSKCKQRIPYIRKLKDGTTKTEQLIKTVIIRHQIHHPDNKYNDIYTCDDLKNSIEEMRNYINSNVDKV